MSCPLCQRGARYSPNKNEYAEICRVTGGRYLLVVANISGAEGGREERAEIGITHCPWCGDYIVR